MADYGDEKIAALLQNSGIIRNRRKIESSINNARHFLEIQKEFGSYDRYIWGFVDGMPVSGSYASLSEIPASTALSDRISNDLKGRGFKFLGTTIVYSHLQATGIVNDHVERCFRKNSSV